MIFLMHSAFSMITSGIVVAGHHGPAQADLAEAKLPILLRGRAQCPSSFRRKVNFGMKTSAYEKKCQFRKCSEILRWPMISNTLGYWAEAWINGKIKK